MEYKGEIGMGIESLRSRYKELDAKRQKVRGELNELETPFSEGGNEIPAKNVEGLDELYTELDRLNNEIQAIINKAFPS